MSNVHGLGGWDQENNDSQQNGENNVPNFLNSWVAPTERKNPREESFFEMLRIAFCPGLTKKSFIFIITAVDILVFVGTFIISILFTTGLSPMQFLGTNQDILNLFDKDFVKMRRDWQFWRFITPIVIHTGFSHLVQNMLT